MSPTLVDSLNAAKAIPRPCVASVLSLLLFPRNSVVADVAHVNVVHFFFHKTKLGFA